METNLLKLNKSFLSLLIFIASLFVSCSSHEKETDQNFFENNLDFYRIKGEVKSLTESVFKTEEKFGEIQRGSLTSKMIYIFNEDGSLDQEQSYGADGILAAKTICLYDSKGNIVEVNYFRDDSLETKLVYKYDGDGNKIERYVYNSDGILSRKFINKFDGEGKTSEEDYYNSNGDLEGKSIFKYDKNGNKILLDSFLADGSLTHRFTYMYDKNHNNTDMSSFNKDLDLNERTIYHYDDNDNMIDKSFTSKYISNRVTYNYEKYDKNKNWLLKIQKYFPENITNKTLKSSQVTMIERGIEYY